jgi:UDP-N-acetylglucosamine 2-epimerase
MFTENSTSVDYLVKSGLKRENFRVVGNPVFYNAFKKRTQILSKDDKKLNILFITANLESGQGKSNFSKSKRNKMIKETITSLNQFHKETFLVIKIHPTAENYTEYKQLLEKFENIHLSQKDDIVDLISKSDVIITPVTSTAAVIALIMNKPIIIWNYFHIEQDLLLKTDAALECKNISELNNCLDSAESFREKNAEKINKLIETNWSYENPSHVITTEILNLLKSRNPHLF